MSFAFMSCHLHLQIFFSIVNLITTVNTLYVYHELNIREILSMIIIFYLSNVCSRKKIIKTKFIFKYYWYVYVLVISRSTSQVTVTKTPLSRTPLFPSCDVVTSGYIPEDGTDTSPWESSSMAALPVGIILSFSTYYLNHLKGKVKYFFISSSLSVKIVALCLWVWRIVVSCRVIFGPRRLTITSTVRTERVSTFMLITAEQGPGWQGIETPGSGYRLTWSRRVSSKESLHKEGEKPINLWELIVSRTVALESDSRLMCRMVELR